MSECQYSKYAFVSFAVAVGKGKSLLEGKVEWAIVNHDGQKDKILGRKCNGYVNGLVECLPCGLMIYKWQFAMVRAVVARANGDLERPEQNEPVKEQCKKE